MTSKWAGADFGLPPLLPAVSTEQMLANQRSALQRGLPELKVCKPHGHTISVAGGGPSIKDTRHLLTGYVAAVNGSLGYLLESGIKDAPLLCGVMDAGEHIADLVAEDKNVRYYIASTCHPSVFDKLRDCEVVLWHVTPQSIGASDEHPALAIGGGCTMGLRWLNLGYVLGFRKFKLHGLDSSFANGSTHAYPDRADDKPRMYVRGRETRPNFLAQVEDFFGVLDTLRAQGPLEIEMFGDGLLQDLWRDWCTEHPNEAAILGESQQ
jgi:hypothetical protein